MRSKKITLLSEKYNFRGREYILLRVTTPNLPMPHGIDLVSCEQEMICLELSTVTGAPVVACKLNLVGTQLQDHIQQDPTSPFSSNWASL